ncbi:hypothetical protein MRX96_051573 [Rhipicephalus microplus]
MAANRRRTSAQPGEKQSRFPAVMLSRFFSLLGSGMATDVRPKHRNPQPLFPSVNRRGEHAGVTADAGWKGRGVELAPTYTQTPSS